MDPNGLIEKSRYLLNKSVVTYNGKPVGTRATAMQMDEEPNYDRVFIRDFAVSTVAFLFEGKYEIVKNFLWETAILQNKDNNMDGFEPGQGLIPASFKVTGADNKQEIVPDYGEKSIAKVPPADSGFWWLYILRMYMKATGDEEFISKDEIQDTVKMILDLTLPARFDIFPTLLVPDGSFMIDRRMGVYGYPLEIQALFFLSLVSAKEIFEKAGKNTDYIPLIERRLGHLVYHIGKYYWLDFETLNVFYNCDDGKRFDNAVNRFNIYPASIPHWIYNWLPEKGGYFAGNLGPGRLDFRFFSAGNLLTIISSLASDNQAHRIFDLIGYHKETFFGKMPFKICYPALSETEWEIITGHDQKNIPWSYHNGGSWPFITWYFAAAATKLGRTELLDEAMNLTEQRIDQDEWPEYYDGTKNQLKGRETRKYQTWSIAGYLAAKHLHHHPEKMEIVSFEEKQEAIEMAKKLSRELDH